MGDNRYATRKLYHRHPVGVEINLAEFGSPITALHQELLKCGCRVRNMFQAICHSLLYVAVTSLKIRYLVSYTTVGSAVAQW